MIGVDMSLREDNDYESKCAYIIYLKKDDETEAVAIFTDKNRAYDKLLWLVTFNESYTGGKYVLESQYVELYL
jgi:hypothetical protein